MIFDKIENFKTYSTIFPEIFEYLQKTDYHQLQVGKYILSEEAFILVNEYNSVLHEKTILENHHDYIDIHLMTHGEEKICFQCIEKLALKKIITRQRIMNYMKERIKPILFW